MGCEWYDPLSYKSCATDVVKSAAGDAFHSIAESFGEAADHAVNWLWTQMSAATAVHLGGAGFSLEIGMTAAIAGTVAVGLFVIQLVQSVLRRDGGGLARAGKGLLVAFIGGGVAIAVVNVLLGATDALCSGVVKVATGTNEAGLGKLILSGTALTSAVGGPAALLLLSLACIMATVVVYGALVVRKVLIVVTAVFAPIAFAGSLADITVSWTRRWIETTVALVVSKLILVLVFITGYGILVDGVGQSGSGGTQQVTQVISGVIVLFLAGFAPLLAMKIVHFTGEHAQQLHALSSGAMGGVATAGRMAQMAAPYAARGAMAARAGAAALSGAAGADGPAGVSGATGAGSPSAGAAGGSGGGPSAPSATAAGAAPSTSAGTGSPGTGRAPVAGAASDVSPVPAGGPSGPVVSSTARQAPTASAPPTSAETSAADAARRSPPRQATLPLTSRGDE